MKIDFDIKVESGIVILYMAGSFNYENLNDFRRLMYTLVSQGVKKIVINLAKLTFIDSTGMGALIAAVRYIFRNNGTAMVVSTGVRIRKLFEQVKTDNILPLFDNENIAIEEMLNPSREYLKPGSTLEKIDNFFNPDKKLKEEIILKDSEDFNIKHNIALYIDIISRDRLERKLGRVNRIMEGKSSMEILLETPLSDTNDKDIYCIISYFSGKQWFEFEDHPFRVESKRLWIRFPRIVAMIERRASLRVPCDFPLVFQICDVVGSRTKYNGIAKNIGENGILLVTDSPFPKCDCVGIQFALPGNSREMVAIGRIVRLDKTDDNSFNFGVHFLIINENSRRAIQKFVIRKSHQ